MSGRDPEITISIAGFAELGAALDELAKTTAKGVMVRTLRDAAQPIVEHAASLTATGPGNTGKHPHKGGRLKEFGWRVGTKLNPAQKRSEKENDSPTFATVYAGAAPYTEAITEEFGTVRGVKPHPMLRPAWDAQRLPTLERIKNSLADNIAKTVARAARRAALKAERLK